MYTCGEGPEPFNDDHGFPLDMDHAGKTWRLKSSADHMTRSKVLFHPSVITK